MADNRVPECPEGARLIQVAKDTFTIVDEEMYDFLMRFKWRLVNGRVVSGGNAEPLFQMSRLVHGTPIGWVCDHINRNPLDNRRCNLRRASSRQNAHNRVVRWDSTTGYKGVTKLPSGGNAYRAYITINGKVQTLGQFKYAEDAARAYDRMAKVVHGRFAALNFPDS